MGQATERFTEKELIAVLDAIKEIALISSEDNPVENPGVEILKKLRGVVPFDAATLYSLNPQEKLEQVAVLGGEVEILNFLELDRGDGLSAWIAESEKPLLLSNRANQRGFNPDSDYASFMSVPLKVDGEVIGVINLGSKEPEAFYQKDVTLMTLALNQIAFSMEKLLYQKKCDDLEKDMKGVRDELDNLKNNIIYPATADRIAQSAASIIHDINNSLSIIVGNTQCMLAKKTTIDQKTMSRVRRIESAAQKISEANQKILDIYGIVNKPSEKLGSAVT